MQTNEIPQTEQNFDADETDRSPDDAGNPRSENEKRYERGTVVDPFAEKNEDASIEKHTGNDLAQNDGSVPKTLDTAFHGIEGAEKEPAGSNRTDDYEATSGQSDNEEELDVIKNDESGQGG